MAKLTQAQLDTKLTAVAYCWRICYESLGLSGYSPLATNAMSVIKHAKSDSGNGFRVAMKLGVDGSVHQYEYAFKVGDELSPKEWKLISGPTELVRLLKEDTNITYDIAVELITSAAIVKTYKKIEAEGLESVGEKSGYFKYIKDGILHGSLRRMGQGKTGDFDPDVEMMDLDPEYDPATAPGKALPEMMMERDVLSEFSDDPFKQLSNMVAVAHQELRVVNEIKIRRDLEEDMM